MTGFSDPPVVLNHRYRLVGILGKGSLGSVYRAADPQQPAEVVIKFIAPLPPASHSSPSRFLHELAICQQLTHPQIVAVSELNQEGSWSYLVLELGTGRTLRRLLTERGRLPLAESLGLIISLLRVVAYVHAQGVLHRNLKPENILLADEQSLLLLDVGLGLAYADPRLAHPIQLRTGYQAPELHDRQLATIESDLYAIGAIWYELLTGQPPGPSDQPLQQRLPPDLPPALEQLIMQLLAPHPDARYHSADAALQALAQLAPLTQMREQHPAAPRRPLTAEQSPHLAQNLELQRYTTAEAVVAAVEAERQHIASMLHQQLVEPVHLLLAQANAYEQSLSGQPVAQLAVSVLGTIARQLLQQLRDLESDLHPHTLETFGLAAALELLAGQFMHSTHVQIDMVIELIPERLPMPSELAIFRMVQAALTHAIQHGHATRISIHLERSGPQLRCTIRDNGHATDQLSALQHVRQRIENLGGRVELPTHQHGGELILLFPLSNTPILTAREMEVLQLLAEGCSNKQIANRLTITPRTVNFHLDHIYVKLEVSTRTEAVITAIRLGWVKQS